jgi:hypothetical protein
MSAFFWASLAFLIAAGLGGTVFVGRRAWTSWQAFVSLSAACAVGTERLAAATEQLAARSEQTAGRVDELIVALERLRRTQARAEILLGAWGEVTSLLRSANIAALRR